MSDKRESTEVWLTVLAGRKPDMTSIGEAEAASDLQLAQRLREAMLDEHEVDAERMSALKARVTARNKPEISPRPFTPYRRFYAIAASVSLCVVGALLWQQSQQPPAEDTEWRAKPQQTSPVLAGVIYVEQPQAVFTELQRQVTAGGGSLVKIGEAESELRLFVQLPAALDAELQAQLKGLGLQLDAGFSGPITLRKKPD